MQLYAEFTTSCLLLEPLWGSRPVLLDTISLSWPLPLVWVLSQTP